MSKIGSAIFVDNGVRKSLIPILISFFQNRVMYVKWRGILSEKRSLPGGGPQGCSMGIIEYLSLSSSSAQFVDPSERYKWVDDLSILEIVNLVNIGLASYNFRDHVASDIGIDQLYLNPNHLKSQSYLNEIFEWTEQQKMKLNVSKTKIMVFNETNKYQFTTRLKLNENLVEIIHETDLLGVKVSADLTWRANTKSLVSRANSRIILLLKLFEFQVPQLDLVNIYKLFIRSILEQSCVVWHSAITKEEENDIERVQKVCLKIILKQDYISYEQALEKVNLQTLVARREKLSLNFARKCLKNDKTKSMFPLQSCSRPPSKRNPVIEMHVIFILVMMQITVHNYLCDRELL